MLIGWTSENVNVQ
uniref:Uncharacterized protein n=1 Tax=Moniliophthora roreri TaxID=221103 RepID=A0A0W0FT04_MONRR